MTQSGKRTCSPVLLVISVAAVGFLTALSWRYAAAPSVVDAGTEDAGPEAAAGDGVAGTENAPDLALPSGEVHDAETSVGGRRFRLSGVVRQGAHRHPVRGAIVEVVRWKFHAESVTDEDGRFSFSDIPFRKVSVVAMPSVESTATAMKTIRPQSAEEYAELLLPDSAALTVFTFDSNGYPVAGAKVRVGNNSRNFVDRSRGKVVHRDLTERTDAAGRAHFASVRLSGESNRNNISLTHPDYRPQSHYGIDIGTRTNEERFVLRRRPGKPIIKGRIVYPGGAGE